ncbi:MAG: tRNA (adenosine(37)-N6)-dimethylallyltransferase MiaA [Lachnospiraceae bacterium]|nr:tRNA (adenosine(37)-N6)-dimethylallyltransferase MiaA [Lachnospiraceae bacterium]
MCEKRPLVVLTGPTAVGKTDLSIALAKRIGAQIISADSAQVYRGMDIGSAKITVEEMGGVKHHLIDVLDPKESFSAAVFKDMADRAIEQIYAQGDIPMIVGGTGFYIQGVIYNIDFSSHEDDESYRRYLEKLLEEKGNAYLYDLLREVDPLSCETIHENNVKRVIRALEFNHLTGRRISEHNSEQRENEAAYNMAYFVLDMDRKKLYERIDKRVEEMLSDGLVDEVRHLMEMGCDENDVSMQALGYRQILAFLKGRMSYDEAVYVIKRDTRHFAKRQLTWFRRERDVIRIDKDEYSDDEGILRFMLQVLNDKKIAK